MSILGQSKIWCHECRAYHYAPAHAPAAPARANEPCKFTAKQGDIGHCAKCGESILYHDVKLAAQPDVPPSPAMERPGAEPEKASLRRCITRDMYQCTLLAGHDGYHRYEWEDDLASLHRREQSPHSSPERERAQETDAQILHELRSRLAREAESLEQNLADVDRRDWGHARAHARAVIKGHCRVLKTWANGEVPVTRWRERFNESETRLTEAERLLRERLDKHRELYCVDEGEECTCGGWAEIRAFLAESRR